MPDLPPPTLAERLGQATALLAPTGRAELPAVVLARTVPVFLIAGLVSKVLDEHTIPSRDAYTTADRHCAQTVAILSTTLDPNLLRWFGKIDALAPAEVERLARDGQTELTTTVDGRELDTIAHAMIALGAALIDHLKPISVSDSVPAALRPAVAVAGETADIVWSHYGGDTRWLVTPATLATTASPALRTTRSRQPTSPTYTPVTTSPATPPGPVCPPSTRPGARPDVLLQGGDR